MTSACVEMSFAESTCSNIRGRGAPPRPKSRTARARVGRELTLARGDRLPMHAFAQRNGAAASIDIIRDDLETLREILKRVNSP